MRVPGCVDVIRVLYVDDEPELLEIGKMYLEQEGEIKTTLATCAVEALQYIPSDYPDVIVSDYQMPGMDGIAFLKIVRAKYPGLPFILFTGRGRKEVVIEALNAGADFYLQKGGDPTARYFELIQQIRHVVSRKKAMEAFQQSEERYRAVVESQTEMICRFLPDRTHIFANDAYCRYFGMSFEELVNTRFIPNIPEPDRSLLRDHFLSLTRASPVATIEHRIVMPDGSIRWQQWSDLAIFQDGGGICEFQSVGRDITEKKALEERVKAPDRLLGTIISHLPDATFAISREGKVLVWNRAMEELTGTPSQEMMGKRDYAYAVPLYGKRRPLLADLVLCADPSTEKTYSPFYRTNDGIIAETRIPQPDGTEKVLWGKATAFSDKNGKLIGAIESIREITAWREAEDERTISEKRYEALFHHLPDGIIIHDFGGRILDVNPVVCAALGYNREELLGMDPSSFTETPDHEGIRARLQAMPSGSVLHLETRHRARDGRIIPVALSNKRIPYNGRDVILSVARDLSQWVEMERLLHLSQASLDRIADPVLWCDMDSRILIANSAAQAVYGYSLEEMQALTLSSISLGATQDTWSSFWKTAETEGTSRLEMDHVTRSGVSFPVSVSGSVVRFDGADYLCAVIHDISARKSSEEAVAIANRKLHTLSRITRHDILNQLTVLNGYLAITGDSITDPSVRGYLAEIGEAASRIRSQVEFTRTYQEIGVRSPVWQEVAKVCSDAISSIPNGRDRIVTRTGKLEIYADALLPRVFYNLFENAFRHGGNVRRITVSASVADNYCRVIIEDDGCGIPGPEKERIFESGYGRNTGHGLFLIREILTISGMEVTECGIPGHGARFEIRVPPGSWRDQAPLP